MEFRLFLPQMRTDLDQLVERSRAAEKAGFSGIALMDHLAPPMAESQPMYEALLTSAFLAARTTTLGIGHLVLCDAMRHPAVLAKAAVTLDHASGGRFELGLGWGSVPDELATFGVGDTSPSARVRRLSETLEVLRALWTGDVVSYHGEFHTIKEGQQQPTPNNPIPIIIGGIGPKTLALVAAHADWWNLPLHHLERLDELRPHAGNARVSVQVMIALVPSEDARKEITEQATRRFGAYGEGLWIGQPSELVDRFAMLETHGVERVYVWFADFAKPATLAKFGAEIISQS